MSRNKAMLVCKRFMSIFHKFILMIVIFQLNMLNHLLEIISLVVRRQMHRTRMGARISWICLFPVRKYCKQSRSLRETRVPVWTYSRLSYLLIQPTYHVTRSANCLTTYFQAEATLKAGQREY